MAPPRVNQSTDPSVYTFDDDPPPPATAGKAPPTAAPQPPPVWGPDNSPLDPASLKSDGLFKQLKGRLDPSGGYPTALGNSIATFHALATKYGADNHASPRTDVDPTPWPPGFDPKTAPVYAHNEIDIPQPPEVVFKALTNATQWPQWYPNSAGVVIAGGGNTLGPNAQFDWTTFGTRQSSQVTLYEPNKAIGWVAKGAGTEAFHRFFLYPDGKGGTHVVTEECQKGPTPTLIRGLMDPGLHAAHQLWLRGLSGAVGAPVATPAPANPLAAGYNKVKDVAANADLDAAKKLAPELTRAGFTLDAPPGDPPKLQRPVVMIPGFTMHADSYDPMAQHLAANPANGPVAVFVSADHLFHLGSAQGQVMTPDEVKKSQIFELEYADPSAPSVDPEHVGDFSQPTGKSAEIAEAMTAIQKATGQQKVDVVAHSAGCTDFRAYLESRTDGPAVNRAVLVGPASHGTAMGNVGEVAGGPLGLAEGGKELALDSPLVAALNQRWDHQLRQVNGGVTIVGVTGAPTPGAHGITDGDGFMTADTVGMPGAGLVMLHGLDPTPVAHLTEIGKGGVLRVVDGALGAP